MSDSYYKWPDDQVSNRQSWYYSKYHGGMSPLERKMRSTRSLEYNQMISNLRKTKGYQRWQETKEGRLQRIYKRNNWVLQHWDRLDEGVREGVLRDIRRMEKEYDRLYAIYERKHIPLDRLTETRVALPDILKNKK